MLLGWTTAETRADAHCICLDQFSRRGKTRGKGFSHKKRRQGYRSWDTCISCRQATHLTPLLEPARLHAYERRLSAFETLPPAAAPWAEIEPRDDGSLDLRPARVRKRAPGLGPTAGCRTAADTGSPSLRIGEAKLRLSFGWPDRTAGTMATPFKARNIMVLAYVSRQRGNLGISGESCA